MKNLTLGVAFPSCDLVDRYIKQAKKKLQKYNIDLFIPSAEADKNAAPFRYSPEKRAKELEDLFKNDQVNAIICARGGFGAQHIVKHLDFDVIKQNPKTFIGYSDATILLNLINQNTGLITQHGPMLKEIANLDEDEFLKRLNKIISKNFKSLLNNERLNNCEIINEGKAKGPLVGGNLSTICASLGTNYEISFHKSILFLEDVGEEFYHIDRLFTMLCDSTKIYEAKAIILGDFSNMTNKTLAYKRNLKEIIAEHLKDFKGPILWNYPAGHKHSKKFLPIGEKVELELAGKDKILRFL